jgi:tetratricopeptide (TPR) repeat protein
MSSSSLSQEQLLDLENKAIEAAIASRWPEAIQFNASILEKKNDYVPALLRAGFAFLQLKKYSSALEYYKRVLKIQPQNTIAIDYVEKIKLQKAAKKSSSPSVVLDPTIFVETPGKTKVVTISQLGQKQVLATLVVGEELRLEIRKRHVEVRTQEGEYIGILPDDIGVRLIYFMEHGSIYSAHVQDASLSRVVVFIREIKKGKKVERMTSFPVDIPGSIAKVMAQSASEEEKENVREHDKVLSDALSDDEIDNEEQDKDAEDELIHELEDDQKTDDTETEMLGIETEEPEEEE